MNIGVIDERQVTDYFMNIIKKGGYNLMKSPKLVNIPQYFAELGLFADYDQMLELADLAAQRHQEVATKYTNIGILYLYPEDLLDECLDEMPPKDFDL